MLGGILEGRNRYGDLCSAASGYRPYGLLEIRLLFDDADKNILSSFSSCVSNGPISVGSSGPIGTEAVKAVEGEGGRVTSRAWILFLGRL